MKAHLALWLIITEYYSRTVSDEVLKMYSRQTETAQISAEDLNVAFDAWCLNPEKCSRFPLPGDLIAIHRGVGSSRAAADQIAADVLKAIGKYHPQYGFTPIPPKDGKQGVKSFIEYVLVYFGGQVMTTIDRFGGASTLWHELNSRQCVLTTVRAQLRDLAQSLIDAPQGSQLAGAIALTSSEIAKLQPAEGQDIGGLLKSASKDCSL